jgi:hypothetical protein
MKTLKRIVTFMGRPRLPKDPLQILYGGSGVIQCPKRRRLWVVANVVYDDSLTPLYAKNILDYERYESLDALKSENPNIDTVVLDNENTLKVYTDEQVCPK